MQSSQNKSKAPSGFSTMSSEILTSFNYHQWIFDKIAPFLLNSILEVGAGHGIYTEKLITASEKVLSVDIDSQVVDYLNNKLNDIENLEILHKDFLTENDMFFTSRKIDTILMINVLEHIKDEDLFLRKCYNILNQRNKGHLIIFVPAGQMMFGPMDILAGHYRRYSKKSLKIKLEEIGFKTIKNNYFNFLGGIGWFVNSKVFKPKNLSSSEINSQIKIFDKCIIPLYRKIDPLFSWICGQSIVYVGSVK